MAQQKSLVSYWPPDLGKPVAGPVKRRHVFYVPGYDPEARSRYRLLFVRELARYTKRFGQDKREVGRASWSEDGLIQSWTISAHPPTGGPETRYDILYWDDLVARDYARPRLLSLLLVCFGTLYALASGTLFKWFRFNWKCGCVIIFPFVTTMLLAALIAAVSGLVHALLGGWASEALAWPVWLTVPIGILLGLACVRALERPLNRLFFWQLANDWVFICQHARDRRRDHDERVDHFASVILDRLSDAQRVGAPPDEILIIGHSSGATTAVEIAARLLARDPRLGTEGTSLALVTLGSGLPLVALQPCAARTRRDIASLVTSQQLVWLDYVAAQDWLNFPGFNPVTHLDLGLPRDAKIANPTIRSARFREIIEDETYRAVRLRPFRMHFQFLMANERAGEYDFFAMTLGPSRVGASAVRRKTKRRTVRAEREPRAA